MSTESSPFKVTIVDQTPNYRTITEGGRVFSRISDAVAEFCDNSIQATRHNGMVSMTREIVLCLSLRDPKSGSSWILIKDNGAGMDEYGMKCFGTYALNQEARGNTADSSSFISKFGVGAKEAGFYLGDRIHVFSRPRGCADVNEMILDSKEYEIRDREGINVFENRILSRSIECALVDAGLDPAIVHQLRQVGDGQFTIVAVRLKELNRRQLLALENRLQLLMDLAEIYHVHLHPLELPESVGPLNREQVAPRTCKVIMRYVRLTPQLEEVENRSLSSIETVFDQFRSKAAECFTFHMTVPDPKEIVPEHEEMTGASNISHTIQGIIFYFPFESGETLPVRWLARKHFLEDVTDNAPSNSSATGDEEMSNAVPIGSFGQHLGADPLFHLFWQERFVPESKVDWLFFIPDDVNGRKKCEKAGLPEKWRSRIRGLLLFDWHFKHISNNKLKIQLDFENWVNKPSIFKSSIYEPRNLKGVFMNWLAECHRKYDREYKYDKRDHGFELDSDPFLKQFSGCGFFERMSIDHLSDSSIEKDSIVRLHLTETDIISDRRDVFKFAKVVAFISKEVLDREQAIYYGDVSVLYRLYFPNSTEQSPLKVVSIKALNLQDPRSIKVAASELKSFAAQVPSSITMKLFHTCSQDNYDEVVGTSHRVREDETYYKVAVQVKDGNGNILTKMTKNFGSGKPLKIRTYCDSNHWGADSILYTTVPNSEKPEGYEDVVFRGRTQAELQDAYYCVYGPNNGEKPISFGSPGIRRYKIEVLDGTRIVLQREVSIHVKGAGVKTIDLEADFSGVIPLGSILPKFSLIFLDGSGQRVEPLPPFQLSIQSDSVLLLQLRDIDSNHPNNEDGLRILEDIFRVLPQPDRLACDHGQVKRKHVKLTFKVDLNGNPGMLAPLQFQRTITVGPGPLHELKFLQPQEFPLLIHQGSNAGLIVLACFDEWGNRTAPEPGTTWICRTSGPLIGQDVYPVLSTGEVHVDSLFAGSDESSLIDMNIERQPIVSLVQDFIVEDALGSTKSNSFLVNIIPVASPMSIKVLQNGLPISQLVSKADSIISDLTVQCYDKFGNCIDLEPTWFDVNNEKPKRRNRGKTMSVSSRAPIECSWVQHQLRNVSVILPNLKAMSSVGDMICTVSLNAMSKVLPCQFVVTIIAGDPTGWKLLRSSMAPTAGDIMLRCKENMFANDKFVGICLMDANRNPVDLEGWCGSLALQCEEITNGRSSRFLLPNGQAVSQVEIPLHMTRVDPKLTCLAYDQSFLSEPISVLVPDEGTVEIDVIGAPTVIHTLFSCTSHDFQLLPFDDEEFRCLPSHPHNAKYLSRELGIFDYSTEHTIPFPSDFRKTVPIEVKFFDSSGNECIPVDDLYFECVVTALAADESGRSVILPCDCDKLLCSELESYLLIFFENSWESFVSELSKGQTICEILLSIQICCGDSSGQRRMLSPLSLRVTLCSAPIVSGLELVPEEIGIPADADIIVTPIGGEFPTFEVKFLSYGRKLPFPLDAVLDYSLYKMDTPVRRLLPLRPYYTSVGVNSVRLTSSMDLSCLASGQYELEVSYKESRPELISYLPQALQSVKTSKMFQVPEPLPVVLAFGGNSEFVSSQNRPRDECDQYPVASLRDIVSAALESTRVIASNVVVVCKDRESNLCKLPKEWTIFCELLKQDGSKCQLAELEFEGEVLRDRSGFLFSRIAVRILDSVDADDQEEKCLLKFYGVDARGDPVLTLTSSLITVTSRILASTEVELSEGIHALEKALRSFDKKIILSGKEISQRKNDQNELLSSLRAKTSSLAKFENFEDYDEPTIATEVKLVREKLHALESRRLESRPLKLKHDSVQKAQKLVPPKHVLGIIGELIQVQDLMVAKLLTWAAWDCFFAVVVQTDDDADVLFGNNVTAISLEPLQARQAMQPANGHQQTSKFLREYASVDKKYEGFRDILLDKLFGNAVLVNSMEAAKQLRQDTKVAGRPMVDIYSLDGCRLRANGLRLCLNDQLPQLGVSFGFTASVVKSEISSLKADLEIFGAIQKLLKSRSDLAESERELFRLKQRRQSSSTSRDRLKEELSHLPDEHVGDQGHSSEQIVGDQGDASAAKRQADSELGSSLKKSKYS